MKQLKISWDEFVEAAMQTIKSDYPDANNPVRMREHGYESDSGCYETPSYVLIDLGKQPERCPYGYTKEMPGTKHECAIHSLSDFPEHP